MPATNTPPSPDSTELDSIIASNNTSRHGGGIRIGALGNVTLADDIEIGLNDFTVQNSFAIDAYDSVMILFSSGLSDSAFLISVTSAGAVDMNFKSGGSSNNIEFPSYVVPVDGLPRDMAVVCDRDGDASLYVNGDLVDTVDISAHSATDIQASGTGNGSCYLTLSGGLVAYGLRAFNFALDADQVLELHRYGVPFEMQFGSTTTLTSGTLVSGKRYRLNDWITADDFTNVGASNADGVEFEATGTTPTTWTNSSVVERLGSVVDLDLGLGKGLHYTDFTDNENHGTGAGVANLVDNYTKRVDLTYSGTLDVDFDDTPEEVLVSQLSGDLTLTGSNYHENGETVWRFTADGTLRTITVPSGWNDIRGVGTLAVAVSSTATMVMISSGTTEAECDFFFTAE